MSSIRWFDADGNCLMQQMLDAMHASAPYRRRK